MRRRRRVQGFLLLLVATSCATPPSPIVPGTYADPSAEETLVVAPASVAVHIRVDDRHPDRFLSREYQVDVHPDGTIRFLGLTSVDAAFGVGRYEWRWDGAAIVRSDPATGTTLVFSRTHP